MGFFKDMPGWEKGLIVLGVLGIGTYTGIQIKKGADKRKSRQSGRELNRDIDNDTKGLKPSTNTQTNFRTLSDKLYSALNRWSPDRGQVYQIFAAMRNTKDVYDLIKAFGMRMDTSNGVSTDVDANLGTFIQKMGDDEIEALNMMLSKKAIKYTF